jgi:glycosyltransferase involved in cell wall biosynthesis
MGFAARDVCVPVSIVITNFNYARFLRASVESALSQDYPDVEVIVVDDGSTDESAALLAELKAEYPRLTVIAQENRGQAGAMNAGFARATGDWIVFLDSDDALDSSAVGVALRNADDDASVLQFFLRTIDAAGNATGIHPFCHVLESGNVFGQICASGHFRFMPTSANVFRRRDLARFLPVPEKQWRICADTYLVFAAASQGCVRTVPGILGSYRIHDANAWYEDGINEGKSRQIVRNHLVVWSQLLDLRQYWPSYCDDYAVSSLVRRMLVSLFLCRGEPGLASADVDCIRRQLRRSIISSRITLGEKALHLLMLYASRGRRSLFFKGLVVRQLGNSGWHVWARRLQSPLRHQWLAKVDIPAQIAELPIGHTIDFGQGGEGRVFQRYGFGHTENWRSWSSAERAGLLFRVPAELPEISLSFEITPYLCEPQVKSQHVEIRANGHPVFAGDLSVRARIAFKLSGETIGEAGVVALDFIFADAVIPALVDPKSRVTRITAVGIASMMARIPAASAKEPHPPLPIGSGIRDFLQIRPYLQEGWDTANGIARLSRRQGRIRFSSPNPVMDRFVVRLEFERVPHDAFGDWRIAAELPGIARDSVDLRESPTLLLVVPRGKAPATGLFDIVCSAADIWPWPGGDDATPGPRFKAMVVQRFDLGPGKLSLWRSHQVLDFTTGGEGRNFLISGWNAQDPDGVWSSDTKAVLGGFYFEDPGEIFLTMRLRAWSADAAPRQHARVLANGTLIAELDIEDVADVLAIVPARLVGADRYLKLEFESRLIGSMPAPDAADSLRHVGICLERLSVQPLAAD